MTAAHFFKDGFNEEKLKDIKIFDAQNKQHSIESITLIDYVHDIALIKSSYRNPSLPKMHIGPPPIFGEKLWVYRTFSEDDKRDTKFAISDSIVDVINREDKEIKPDSFTIRLKCYPGHSGSPIFNKNGSLVGILIARNTKGEEESWAAKPINIYSALRDSGAVK